MIIVSQDKESIINFNKVNIININKHNLREIDAFFNCDESYDDDILLGVYTTEERAKEVLRKIIQSYREYRTAVFEMPEE